jgi:hypothetical protein
VSAPVPPREECWAGAHEVLERALARIARDRAAGRLTPEVAAHLDRVAPVPQQLGTAA